MDVDFATKRTYLFLVMFDEEPLKHVSEFPRTLEGASIEELQDYIVELKSEIERVEKDIEKKKASAAAAASVFK